MRIGGFVPVSLCDYPCRVAAVVFTQGCNFRCPFCHNGHLLDRHQYLRYQILRENRLDFTFKKILDPAKSGLTEKDAVAGIREALVKCTGESVKIVSKVNGYFANPEIKIPFPPEARDVETKLRAIGCWYSLGEIVRILPLQVSMAFSTQTLSHPSVFPHPRNCSALKYCTR